MGHINEHAQNGQFQIHPAHTQFYPGVRSVLMHTILSNDSVSGQRMAQIRPDQTVRAHSLILSDLGIRCPHMLQSYNFA